MKKCTRCGVQKPKSEFYKEKRGRDGLRSRCKQCHAEMGRIYSQTDAGRAATRRSNQSEKGHARSRRHRQTEKGRQTSKRTSLMYYKRHPERRQAKQKVSDSVRAGKMPRVSTLTCDECGKFAEHYHHESYEREHWMDVMPLCNSCHLARHARP